MTDRQTDKRADRQTDRQTVRQTDRQTDSLFLHKRIRSYHAEIERVIILCLHFVPPKTQSARAHTHTHTHTHTLTQVGTHVERM